MAHSHSVKPEESKAHIHAKQQLEALKVKIAAVKTESAAKSMTAELLSSANQPGKSQYYLMAEKLLRPYVEDSKDPALWYMWASIQQHEHRFGEAKKQLARLFKVRPNDLPAHLMAARLALIERDLSAAKDHCQATLGHADVMTTTICLLEVESYQGDLQDSYDQLVALVAKRPLPETHQNWVVLMLTDMALRNKDHAAAQLHLNQFPDFNDISYLTAWADVKLATAEEKAVLNKLHDLNDSGVTLEDGLLLRLALAEQQLNRKNNTHSDDWKEQLMNRLKFRVKREETMHANEMARYYLSIDPKPRKALSWAKRNWETSKEHQDELLLDEAHQSFNKFFGDAK